MDLSEPEVEPHFSQPVRQISSMLIALALVAAGLVLAYPTFRAIFLTNPWLNGAISAFFVLGVLACFRQVVALMRSVGWIEAFARDPRDTGPAPALLLPLATLLRSRGARMQLSPGSSRSILESVGQRIEEDREITRYLSNTLIFLGLLGTFYGLATTVPALVETIRSLNPADDESGAAIFGRLQAGLEAQLGGMGTAFSSSLLGLAGSLVVGLLELFATHGQNRFYRELEEWLSTITRIGYSSGDEGGATEESGVSQVVDRLADQIEALNVALRRSDEVRSRDEAQLGALASALTQLAERLEGGENGASLDRLVSGQERLIAAVERDIDVAAESETRMRLRSMDIQLLRILEEISAGRQEVIADLRIELASLGRALRQNGGGGASPLRATRNRADG